MSKRLALAVALLTSAIACGGKAKPPKDPPPLVDNQPAQPAATPVAEPEPAPPAEPAPAEPAEPAPTGKPEMSDADFEQLMREIVTFISEFGDGVVAAKRDCKKMARNLEATLKKYEPLMKRAKSFEDGERAARRAETWMRANQARMRPILEKFKGIEACQHDPDVKKAVESFGRAGGG